MAKNRISYTYDEIVSHKYSDISDPVLNISETLLTKLQDKNIIKKCYINSSIKQVIIKNLNKLNLNNIENICNLFFEEIQTIDHFHFFVATLHEVAIRNKIYSDLYANLCFKLITISNIRKQRFWNNLADQIMIHINILSTVKMFQSIDFINTLSIGKVSLDDLDKYNKKKEIFIGNIYFFSELYIIGIIGDDKVTDFINKSIVHNSDASIYYSIIIMINIVKKINNIPQFVKIIDKISKCAKEKNSRTQFAMLDLKQLL